ncbi:MAG TPA: lysophospholipid acyltransferase family protein [Smithella sp.]|nr:lysophospholipid acyltransferase family protein [Smithella sp.]HRS97168.1 lysophospholipid acyltransferase family protein [Smithella sp.]
MSRKAKILLLVQNGLGRMAILFLAPLYFLAFKVMFYRVGNLREIRRRCQAEIAAHEGGWLICSNHLTMIDSFILSYAIFGLGGHIAHYKKLPWNLPEIDNYRNNWFLTALCYLSKCIPVNRGGSREKMKETMAKCVYLLERGGIIMIFPEGRRSRTGYVDREGFSYGPGRLIKRAPNVKVMCMYLRGERQKNFSAVPVWGEKFYVRMEVFTPRPLAGGDLRAQRDYSAQIIEKIAAMEEEYFALCGKRRGGFEGTGQRRQEREFAFPEKNSHRC